MRTLDKPREERYPSVRNHEMLYARNAVFCVFHGHFSGRVHCTGCLSVGANQAKLSSKPNPTFQNDDHRTQRSPHGVINQLHV